MKLETMPEPKRRTLVAWIWHWWHVFIDAGKQWMEDRAMTLGSSLAYYTLFSLSPLLLLSIALAGVVVGGERARAALLHELHETLGSDVASSIETILSNADKGGATAATLFGLAILLFGASGVFVELRGALNQIWKVKNASSSGIVSFLRGRILSLAAVVSMGILLLVLLVLSSILSILGNFVGEVVVWQLVTAFVSLVLIALLFALVYKFLPDAEIYWSDVWGGAFTAALLFTLGKQGFSFYLSQAGVASVYGSAASVIVVMLWVYYSSLILLFGAEVAHAHAARLRPGVDFAKRRNGSPLSGDSAPR